MVIGLGVECVEGVVLWMVIFFVVEGGYGEVVKVVG